MSKFCPEGVRYFGYTSGSDKGKFQPASVQAGQTKVQAISGSQPAIKQAKGGAGATPAGVHKHSGTMDCCKVKHMNASHGGPSRKAGADACPEGVRKFGDTVSKK